MRFAIVGAGGIGGFFGGMLAKCGEDVWFVARGAHFEAMKQDGLQITSTVGTFTVPPTNFLSDPAALGQADVILFCVKSYDTESAADLIAPALHADSLIISLQNGVDNIEKISHRIQRGVVFGGAAYISSRITAPGRITETGGFQRIVFGPESSTPLSLAQEVRDCLERSGIKCTLADDIRAELWRKLIFISSMGSLTALSRLTHGEILHHPRTRTLMFDAMREARAVAVRHGIPVEPVDEPKVLEGLKKFSEETRSSMYFDLVAEKPMEVEALNGTVVRLGEQLGVPTPTHRLIYSLLLPHHIRHSGRRPENSTERTGIP